MNEITYTGPRGDVDLDEAWLGELIADGGTEIVVALRDDRGDKDEIARFSCAGMSGSRAREIVLNRASRAVSVLPGACTIHVAVESDGRTLGWAPFVISGGGVEESPTPTPDERGVIGHLLKAAEMDKKYLADYQRSFMGTSLREAEKKDRKIEKLEAAVEALKEQVEDKEDRKTQREILKMQAEGKREERAGLFQLINTVATVVGTKFMPEGYKPKLTGPVMTDPELMFFRLSQLATDPRWIAFIGSSPPAEQQLWSTVIEVAGRHKEFMNPHQIHASQARLSDLLHGWMRVAEEKFGIVPSANGVAADAKESSS
jgi:hypothetical protein